MKTTALWGMIVGMLAAMAVQAGPPTLPGEDRILPSSLELERRTQPWCPNDCAIAVPFVATYHRGTEDLVFVGIRHAFQPNSPTMHAVSAGFRAMPARVVILEGFPTLMGENPPPLVHAARRYGAPGTQGFGRGEAMYAASLALSRGIPFIGGESPQSEQLETLKAKGFTSDAIVFGSLVGWFSQSLRSGDIPDTSEKSVEKIYPALSQAVRSQIQIDAPTLAMFRQRYRATYGVDIVGDAGLPLRGDAVVDPTRVGQQNRINMVTRDRHLLGLIEQQLAERHSVLVVYGGSHWSTLSAALEQLLGQPKVRPFLR